MKRENEREKERGRQGDKTRDRDAQERKNEIYVVRREKEKERERRFQTCMVLHENCKDSRARFRNDTFVMLARRSRKLLVKQIQKSDSWVCEKFRTTITDTIMKI